MLPIEAVLDELATALEANGVAVLIAPPGAGKTTGVPPALLDAPWRRDGRIIVIEPRRLAARAAAARVAKLAETPVGGLVGYRVRNETAVSRETRIEFVTTGVFVRMILDDPALDGVAAVLLDEAHERALDGDLGLALALDARAALRPELRLLVMSATLDGRRFAALLEDAPVLESVGRAFPVETVYLGTDPALRIEDRMARAVLKGLAEERGSILAFLPGQAEIARTAERLEGRLPGQVILAPLLGSMEPREQDAAIRPPSPGLRKVVLATSIAETSLTIEGVRLVVDCGLSRRPRFDPGSGMGRLETVRASRATIDQRRGRAGRTEPGVCYRLWDEPQTAALLAFERPEILDADLAPLALALLAWGVDDPKALRWLDPPPAAAYSAALDLLRRLGARDPAGGLSTHGRRLADLPLPPRLAHMVLAAGERGGSYLPAEVAAILSEPGLGGRDVDLRHRLETFRRDRSTRAKAAREAARRWARLAAKGGALSEGTGDEDIGALVALAYPERLAQARGGRGRFRLASGGGARLDEANSLAGEPYLAIAEVQGSGAEPRILSAAPVDRASIESLFGERTRTEVTLSYDAPADAVRGRRVVRLDGLVLAESAADVPDDAAAALLAEAAVARGLATLPWPDDLASLRQRIAFLRVRDPLWPDLSDQALAERADEWLVAALERKRRLADLSPADLRSAFAALLPWQRLAELDRLAPASYAAPSGRSAPIHYGSGEPVVRLAVQNLFGLTEHPRILGGAIPLVFELLSPAARPIQITRDLPAFWQGSWRDVRADMRGRYPKHSWPEDPATAEPTVGAKRRG
jgi:ATP-dependent helicase HrpB